MSDFDYFKIKQRSSSSNHTVDRRYSFFDVSEQLEERGRGTKRVTLPERERLFAVLLACTVIVCVLLGRLLLLQIIKGEQYLAQAQGNYIRTQVIDAPRGLVFDTHGELLVENKPLFYLSFIAADLSQGETLHDQLQIVADITDESYDDMLRIVEETPRVSFRSTPLVDDLSYEEVVALRTSLSNWAGLEVGIRGARSYVYGPYTSHILGYLGKISPTELEDDAFADYQLTDYVGKSGLEQYYEYLLRGKPGKRQVEINVRGQVQKLIKEEPTEAGSDLVLTIDNKIQTKLYDLLSTHIETLDKQKAAAIAIDPRDGSILAAVSLPSYNNNIFTGRIDSEAYQAIIDDENLPLFFRPLQGEYPSGSTFKPVIALAALDFGIITPTTSFLSTGGVRINQWFFPDWQAGGHGQTNVIKAIAESVNTFFYLIGGGDNESREGLGIDRIVPFAQQLFFTKRHGVDFPVEGDGFLPTREWKETTKQERWYIGDTYNTSIGQGDVLVTPLQITNMMAYFANGGTLYQPHFLKEIKHPNGEVQVMRPATLVNDLVPQRHIATVREGLKATVDWGSARSLNVFKPFSIAGKTGTAQVGGDLEPHAWFTSFAPYEQPTIALTILVEHGENPSAAATPVAREFYRWYISEYYSDN